MLVDDDSLSIRPVRLLGALVGGAFGFVLIGVGLLVASPGEATEAAVGVGLVVVILGGLLGALFAPNAVRPGLRAALATSAGVTAVAVPLGAVGLAALQFGGRASSLGEAVAATFAIAFVGLLLLGLPMAGLTFVVVNLWVALLRLVVHQVSLTDSGAAD